MKCEIKNGILNISGLCGIENEMIIILNPPGLVMYTRAQFEKLTEAVSGLGSGDRAMLFRRKLMSSAELCEVKNGGICLPEYFSEYIGEGEFEAVAGEAYTEIKKIQEM